MQRERERSGVKSIENQVVRPSLISVSSLFREVLKPVLTAVSRATQQPYCEVFWRGSYSKLVSANNDLTS